MDERKRRIILESSSTYLRGTDIYINEDLTAMQQAEVRKNVAARKAKLEEKKKEEKKKKGTQERDTDSGSA